MQALSKKKTGDICTIKWMFGIPDVLDFLRSRKIKEGSTVQVIQRINGGLILGMDGKRIAMCFNKYVPGSFQAFLYIEPLRNSRQIE